MSEINFFEPQGKKPEKRDLGTLLLIVIIVLAAVVVAFITLRKSAELGIEAKKRKTMTEYTENPEILRQLQEIKEVQDSIGKITQVNKPITEAYINYKILNTVTSSLIDNYVWAPIKANPDTMEFRALSVFGNNLTINVCVNDTGVMKEYQSALIDMTVNVDKDYIDKVPGAERALDDIEIKKFKDQFTTQIVRNYNPLFVPPYEGTLGIFINKDITEDMYNLLGKGQ